MAALTDLQMLELIDGVLAGRAAADFPEAYSQAFKRWEGTPFRDLIKAREMYAERVQAATQPTFLLGSRFSV